MTESMRIRYPFPIQAFLYALFLVFPLLAASPSIAQPANAGAIERQFQAWLKSDLWPEAQRAGVSAARFNEAFAGVSLNWKLPDLVAPGEKPKPPKNQHQAEFGAPSRYFSEKVLGAVVAGGRSRFSSMSPTLAAIERKSGVPGRFLLAIWGRESGFGRAKIPYDAFEVLGTKAFMASRKEMFRRELVAALVMLEKGLVTRAMMKSSWAGALGQPQFLPTSYLEHAADGDGDGRADIWNSQADTLASIAGYLKHHGWQTGRDWGFEVSVPASLSCALEGPDQGKSTAQWASLGVKRISGKPFPQGEMSKELFLLMPAGRLGPAFLVTANFYVLKDYNESDLYALFIGNAADRIRWGGGTFAAPWSGIDKLYRSDIAAMQRGLEKLGHDVGGADGLPGFKTRRSIGKWEASKDLSQICFPSQRALSGLK
ncbi:MAG: lytic murein transglycosylase [Rhizobiaceae bacterium]